MKYLGHLQKTDPLYNYLCRDIMPQIGASGQHGFRVFSNRSSHAVYIYEDRETGKRVVGKFFASDGSDFERAKQKMYREFHNICKFRKYLGNCHYVAKPLGCREDLNCLLTVEYCHGEPLDSIILNAIRQNNYGHLYEKLSALGNFLATVHNRSVRPVMVDFQSISRYFELIVRQLKPVLHHKEENELMYLGDQYKKNHIMYQDQEVIVHGDATPSNFFFGDGMYVITFDLERMHYSDRLFDTGRIAAELQHFFLMNTENKYNAEPFIGHFLWEYSCCFPDRKKAFESITSRLPFYLGLTLLRIARNSYHSFDYRRKLIEEAKKTLKQ